MFLGLRLFIFLIALMFLSHCGDNRKGEKLNARAAGQAPLTDTTNPPSREPSIDPNSRIEWTESQIRNDHPGEEKESGDRRPTGAVQTDQNDSRLDDADKTAVATNSESAKTQIGAGSVAEKIDAIDTNTGKNGASQQVNDEVALDANYSNVDTQQDNIDPNTTNSTPEIDHPDVDTEEDEDKVQIQLPDVNGSVRRLEDYGGRVYLIHFFSIYCLACYDEGRWLAENKQELSQFTIISIGVGETAVDTRRWLAAAAQHVDWPVWIDENSQVFTAIAGDVTYPFVLLLDQNRHERGRFERMPTLARLHALAQTGQ